MWIAPAKPFSKENCWQVIDEKKRVKIFEDIKIRLNIESDDP